MRATTFNRGSIEQPFWTHDQFAWADSIRWVGWERVENRLRPLSRLSLAV